MSTLVGLQGRALIALTVFSFARVGAALAMRGDDVYVQQRCLWVRLREKGGKAHAMSWHHTLEVYLRAYLEHVSGTGLARDRSDRCSGPLRGARGS